MQSPKKGYFLQANLIQNITVSHKSAVILLNIRV